MTTIEWLKDQCNKHSCGTCSSRSCLVRGGYGQGEPDYSKATCHAHEALSELSALQKENAALTRGFNSFCGECNGTGVFKISGGFGQECEACGGMGKTTLERTRNQFEAITKIADSLRTQNRELREACKLSQIALKEYDLLVANGDFYFNCKCHKSGPAQQAINKALALQPEKI